MEMTEFLEKNSNLLYGQKKNLLYGPLRIFGYKMPFSTAFNHILCIKALKCLINRKIKVTLSCNFFSKGIYFLFIVIFTFLAYNHLYFLGS